MSQKAVEEFCEKFYAGKYSVEDGDDLVKFLALDHGWSRIRSQKEIIDSVKKR